MLKRLSTIVLVVLAAVFAFAGYKLVTSMLTYRQAADFYSGVSETYVQARPTGAAASQSEATARPQRRDMATLPPPPVAEAIERTPAPTRPPMKPAAEWARTTEEQPPIVVDFESLLERNPDVAGWLYCEGTAINYPVMLGEDNDEYIHHTLDGDYSDGGSIFMDAACDAALEVDNTIIYGHNMKDGSMFADLSQYGTQSYYEAHPVMWLLTPDVDFRIDLFASFVTQAGNWAYQIDFARPRMASAVARATLPPPPDSLGETPAPPPKETDVMDKSGFIYMALNESRFAAALEPNTEDSFITLSTCYYAYDNARYVVIGALSAVVEK